MEAERKIRVGIIGFDALGKATAKAVTKVKDFELLAIFTKHDPAALKSSLAKVHPISAISDWKDRIDVMILCDPFGNGLGEIGPAVAKLFHTVDAHPLRGNPPSTEEVEAEKQLRVEELERLAKDLAQRQARREAAAGYEPTQALGGEANARRETIETKSTEGETEEETTIVMGMTLPGYVKEPVFQPVYKPFSQYFDEMNTNAKASGHASLCAVGWEPGLFSVMRTISDALFPKSKTYTFWGRGVSMQWSNAVKAFAGVLDAVVYQVPKEEPLTALLSGEPIYDDSRKALHYLEAYVVADPKYDKEQLREQILHMPGWFKDYDTQVTFLSPDEMREFHSKLVHAGLVMTKASTSQGVHEQIKLEIDMDDNPEFTAYVMAAAARAAYRAGASGWNGAFTMVDVPLAWFHPESPEKIRQQISVS